MGLHVAVVKPPLAIMDNLHVGADVVIALNHRAVNVNPHDRQIGGVKYHPHVVRRIVGGILGKNLLA